MKRIVIVYSYTGKTKMLALKKCRELAADLLDLHEEKRRSTFKAYTQGCYWAIKGREERLLPTLVELVDYDEIILMGPLWASNPAPAFHNILNILPEGKRVSVIMTSGSGRSPKAKELITKKIVEKECTLVSYTDVKASSI